MSHGSKVVVRTYATTVQVNVTTCGIQGPTGSGGGSANIQVDSNVSGDGYGTLTGSGTGPYTVSQGNYVAGTLRVFVAGQRQSPDNFSQISTASGTFSLAFDPGSASVMVDYNYA